MLIAEDAKFVADNANNWKKIEDKIMEEAKNGGYDILFTLDKNGDLEGVPHMSLVFGLGRRGFKIHRQDAMKLVVDWKN